MAHKKKIDPQQVIALAQLGATTKEIAAFMHCSDATINNRFQPELDHGRANLKISLRRAQIRLAIEKDNATMQIWLGKQLLKQTDQQVISINEGQGTDDNDSIADGLIKKLGDK